MAAKGHRVGYQRVSTLDQNVERRTDDIADRVCINDMQLAFRYGEDTG